MAKLKWTAFAHPSKSFVYAGDALKKNWAKLHRGDPSRTQAEISVLVVHRSAPDDLSAELGGVTHQCRFPDHRAFFIGIVRPYIPTLLPGD